MAVAIAAAVLSISTMGDATTVEAFLVFSKCRLSVEFRCALCIDAQRPRFILANSTSKFAISSMRIEKLKFLNPLKKNI